MPRAAAITSSRDTGHSSPPIKKAAMSSAPGMSRPSYSLIRKELYPTVSSKQKPTRPRDKRVHTFKRNAETAHEDAQKETHALRGTEIQIVLVDRC